jgi:hypothetical protein
MKWQILQNIPPYAPETQTEIIVACMALHNFMRTSGKRERHFHRLDNNENYVPQEAYDNQPDPEVVDDESDLMNEFRDSIAYAMASRS